MFETDETLCRRLVNMAKEFFTSLKEAYDNTVKEYGNLTWEDRTAEGYEVQKFSKEAYKEAARLYAEGLKVISGEYEGKFDGEAKKSRKEATSTEAKFSERSRKANDVNPRGLTLEEQLNEAYSSAESFDQRYVYVGEFTEAFRKLLANKGVTVKNYPIVMNYRDAYISMHSKESGKYNAKGINYHNLGVGGLRSVLESFSSPQNIILSRKNGRIELVLSGFDGNGKSVLSIVEINTKAQNAQTFIMVHVVTSAYVRRNVEKYVSLAESEGRLVYTKIEEITQGIPQVQYEGDININSSNNNIPNSSENVNKNSEKHSDRDAEYMQAVKDGDAETQKKLVEEAAKRAGYTKMAFHGSEYSGKISRFQTPSFFSSDRKVASSYASDGTDNVYSVYLNTDGFYVLDGKGDPNRFIDIPDDLRGYVDYEFRDSKKGVQTDVLAAAAKEAGYNGIVFQNIADNGYNNREWIITDKERGFMEMIDLDKSDVYVAFFPEEIKSADLVTYDDNGNVIPLSERFNSNKTDIRYSSRDGFKNALTGVEWKKYNSAITSKVDAGLRINDHALLVECEESDYAYKLVIYDNTFEDNPIQQVYGIGNDDFSSTTIHEIARTITNLEDKGYARKNVNETLKSIAKVHRIILGRYNNGSSRYIDFIRGNKQSRSSSQNQSNRRGVSDRNQENQISDGKVKLSDRDPELVKKQKAVSAALEKENAKLAEDNKYLKELVKIQGKLTHGTKFTKSSVDKIAGRIMREYGARGNKAELSAMLNGLAANSARYSHHYHRQWK